MSEGDNGTMTITEFLLARITEDEELATEALPRESDVYGARGWFDPARVLAECAAKRAIIEEAAYWDDYGDGSVTSGVSRERLGEVLRRLAAVYVAHPDYQQEWDARS